MEESLEQELQAAVVAARRFARRNYLLGYLIAGLTVLSSIAAGLAVSLDQVPKGWQALLASLPAAMVASTTVFRFEQKSAWFWRKSKQLDMLLRAIRYEGLGAADASKLFSKLEVEMEQEWVSFGAMGKSGERG
ncbi:hypothetical protein [Pelomonas sp. KK5]|uniref:hypothetical protein n=1 Tax=Pelomonas sp. KK5 TaxID=1855730 RepID=UPI00097CADB9|nr:hypothetical protein [Pelomonas sp. KK5]